MGKQSEGKPLPVNLEAERSVLGAVLMDNDALLEIAYLRAEDFSLPEHQVIFATMREMHKDKESIDIITLCDRLQVEQELHRAGGHSFVAGLATGIPKVSNTRHYAKIVHDKSILRSICHASEIGLQLAWSGEMEAEKVAEQLIKSLTQLSVRQALSSYQTVDYRAATMRKLSESEDHSIVKIHTGISDLDAITGGFRPGELVTVTAGTGVGKTLFAQQTRRNSCRNHGLHSLYCSAEMTASELCGREIATEAGIPHWKMRNTEHLSHEDYQALAEATGNECTLCKIVEGDLSLNKIWAISHMLKHEQPLHCVIIDYDELVEAPGRDELQQQKNLVKGAKALAVSLALPVIMIAQLRKSPDPKEAKKPTLERLYGSGAKSKHSSFVLFVDREYVREMKGDERKARICILKSRSGRVGQIDAMFNLSSLRFEDVPPEVLASWSAKKAKKGNQAAPQDDDF